MVVICVSGSSSDILSLPVTCECSTGASAGTRESLVQPLSSFGALAKRPVLAARSRLPHARVVAHAPEIAAARRLACQGRPAANHDLAQHQRPTSRPVDPNEHPVTFPVCRPSCRGRLFVDTVQAEPPPVPSSSNSRPRRGSSLAPASSPVAALAQGSSSEAFQFSPKLRRCRLNRS